MKASAVDAEVLLRYGTSSGWLDGQPAAISRAHGKGRITYIGADLDDKLVSAAAAWMTQKSGVAPAFGPVPDGVEVNRRTGPGKQLFIFINFNQEPQKVFPAASHEIPARWNIGRPCRVGSLRSRRPPRPEVGPYLCRHENAIPRPPGT